MPFSLFRSGVLLALLVASLPGCSYFQAAEPDVDNEFAEFDRDEKADKAEEGDDRTGDAKLSEGELELKLKVGDRFPLKKRIEQRLTQSDAQGRTFVNVSKLEMLLSLEVEEVKEGNKRLSVRYHKIHYGHNIAGSQVEFDSERGGVAPTEALVYAGLKDNGFSFWIGPDNRVVELVGFQDFLYRCVQNVPTAYRDAVMRQLEGTHGDDGLSNFVDDGIGLLPYSDDPRHPAVAVKVGSYWDLKPRRSEGSIPMSVSTRCVLKSLTDSTAEISLVGRITGSTSPVSVQDGNRYMRVLVKNGHCAGSCTVDRRTGLPTQSEVNRFLEMAVQLPDGSELQQRKDVLTTITSFLDQTGVRDSTANMNRDRDANSSQLARTSGFGRDAGSNRVTQAVGTSEMDDGGERGSRSERTVRRSDARSPSRMCSRQ